MATSRAGTVLPTGTWSVGLGIAALGALLYPVLANTAQEPKAAPRVGQATISGTVKAGKRLPPMIVYLESTDPKRKFPLPAKPVLVSQQGARFSPKYLVIAVGQTVEFLNDEDRAIEHNVFSKSPTKTFDLGLYRPPDSKSVTFDKPGPVRLFCSIHRYMDGTVYVCPTPFFAHVAKDGRYAISGIPPGEYFIKTWQRRRRFREQTKRVQLDAGGQLVIDWELTRK